MYSFTVLEAKSLKSKVSVEPCMLSLKALWHSFLASSHFWWLLAIVGIPWLTDSSCPSLPLVSHVLLSCVCVSSVFSSLKDTSHSIKTHPNPEQLHLNLSMSAKSYFQIRLHLQTSGRYDLGGYYSTQGSALILQCNCGNLF